MYAHRAVTETATTSVPLPVYLEIDGEVQGPFNTAELSHLWRAGEIDPAALYWFRGMSAWAPAAEFRVPADGLRVDPAAVRLTTASAIAGRTIETEVDVLTAASARLSGFAQGASKAASIAGGASGAASRLASSPPSGASGSSRSPASIRGRPGSSVIAPSANAGPGV